MRNLWFDGRYINTSHPDGITRFSIGLIRELSKLTDLSVLVSSNAQERLMPDRVRTIRVNAPTSLREFFLAARLRREEISVLLAPCKPPVRSFETSS